MVEANTIFERDILPRHAFRRPGTGGRGLTERNHATKNVVMNRNYLRAIPREWRTLSRAFTALGDEHRQRILLTFGRGERLNVGRIVGVSTLSRSAVSHHLRLLREAGVLQSEKVGKEVFYWIDKEFLEGALGAVLEYVRRKT